MMYPLRIPTVKFEKCVTDFKTPHFESKSENRDRLKSLRMLIFKFKNFVWNWYMSLIIYLQKIKIWKPFRKEYPKTVKMLPNLAYIIIIQIWCFWNIQLIGVHSLKKILQFFNVNKNLMMPLYYGGHSKLDFLLNGTPWIRKYRQHYWPNKKYRQSCIQNSNFKIGPGCRLYSKIDKDLRFSSISHKDTKTLVWKSFSCVYKFINLQ